MRELACGSEFACAGEQVRPPERRRPHREFHLKWCAPANCQGPVPKSACGNARGANTHGRGAHPPCWALDIIRQGWSGRVTRNDARAAVLVLVPPRPRSHGWDPGGHCNCRPAAVAGSPHAWGGAAHRPLAYARCAPPEGATNAAHAPLPPCWRLCRCRCGRKPGAANRRLRCNVSISMTPLGIATHGAQDD